MTSALTYAETNHLHCPICLGICSDKSTWTRDHDSRMSVDIRYPGECLGTEIAWLTPHTSRSAA